MQADIEWIGHSNRHYQGAPDTFFGWYRDADGTAVVVKRLNPEAHPHAELLAHHEATMLRTMAEHRLAAPRLLKHHDTELHIEFAGYSLKWLVEQCPTPPTPAELALIFASLCRSGKACADAQFLFPDIKSANLVVPMEDGANGGRLCFDQAKFIDCSDALNISIDFPRPLWINHRMPHIPPEVAELLADDQEEMARQFREDGLELRDLCDTPTRDFIRLRENYRAYQQSQKLQESIVECDIELDPAMQFSLGTALNQCLLRTKENYPDWENDPLDQLACVASRMTQPDPLDRYLDLEEAAADLELLGKEAAAHSRAPLQPVSPEDVIYCTSPGSVPPTTNDFLGPMDGEASDAPFADGTYPPGELMANNLPSPSQGQPRIWAGLGLLAGVLVIFTLGGMRMETSPEEDRRIAEYGRLTSLEKQLKKSNSDYATTLITLKNQTISDRNRNPSAYHLALESINNEMRDLRKRLVAGLMRDSLPRRLLKGETKAMREWQEIQPKLKALADIGIDDARRWLDYCAWAAGNKPHTHR